MSGRTEGTHLVIAAPPTGTGALPAALLLPHTAASALAARRAVASDLAERGLSEQLREATVLVLSELLSNAVKHGRPLADGNVRLSWEVSRDGVQLAVTDGGSATTRPRVSPAAPTETGGRGLAIVGQLTSDWGFRDEQGTTTVWALVPRGVRSRTRTSRRGVSPQPGAPLPR